MCPLNGQEREFRMRTGTTVRYISKSMDIYSAKATKKKKKKKRETKLTNELQNIWNEIRSCMLKGGEKKDLRRREECKTMPTCVFCSPVDLLECCQEFLALLPSRAESARITTRAGNVGNFDLECFHHKFYR
ncbi:hypothetical protein ACS0PU_001725 [Formica fusca]